MSGVQNGNEIFTFFFKNELLDRNEKKKFSGV